MLLSWYQRVNRNIAYSSVKYDTNHLYLLLVLFVGPFKWNPLPVNSNNYIVHRNKRLVENHFLPQHFCAAKCDYSDVNDNCEVIRNLPCFPGLSNFIQKLPSYLPTCKHVSIFQAKIKIICTISQTQTCPPGLVLPSCLPEQSNFQVMLSHFRTSKCLQAARSGSESPVWQQSCTHLFLLYHTWLSKFMAAW